MKDDLHRKTDKELDEHAQLTQMEVCRRFLERRFKREITDEELRKYIESMGHEGRE